MYHSELDERRRLLVCRLIASSNDELDFQTHLDRMLAACRATAGSHQRVAILAIFDRHHGLPSAATRRRIAEVTSLPEFRPHLAIVTENAMVRGVLTALSWLRRPRYESKLVATPEEAIAWLEMMRGEALPELFEMVRNAQNDPTPTRAR